MVFTVDLLPRSEWTAEETEVKRNVLSRARMSQVHRSHKQLCETNREEILLTSEDDPYEYLPSQYLAITCKTEKLSNRVNVFIDGSNGQCAELNMECVQQYRMLNVMQRRKDDSSMCWEPVEVEIVVPYGCECMNVHKPAYTKVHG